MTAIFYLPLVVGLVLLGRSGRQRRTWQAWIMRHWARSIRRILGMRLGQVGPSPPSPCLLVANHLSYVDIIALAEKVPGAFVAKSEISGWPFFGEISRASGVIFVNRGSKRDLLRVTGEIEEAMNEGRSVILFPEATTGTGEALLPFKPSLLEVAARSGRSVHYACLSYATANGQRPAAEVVCWVGGRSFLSHVLSLLLVPGFTATVHYGEEAILDDDRKELTRRLQTLMERDFSPTPGAG